MRATLSRGTTYATNRFSPETVLPSHDDPVSDLGVLSQDGFDLSQFDSVATDLHLMVETSQVLEAAVGPIADTVPSPVQARRGSGAGKGRR